MKYENCIEKNECNTEKSNGKTVLLVDRVFADWAYEEWERNGLIVKPIFKEVPRVLRAIRRIWLHYKLPFGYIWINELLNLEKEAGKVIFHVNQLTTSLPKFINRIDDRVRVIAWYWDSIGKENSPKLIRGKCELWSFDPKNCLEYNLRFNHQYYFKSFLQREIKNEICYDVFFCAIDSAERTDATINAYESLKAKNINLGFFVVNPLSEKIPNEIASDRLPYDSIIEKISQSRAILEIVKRRQTGATIRTMEAIYFDKKLITNNTHIRNEPFYNPNNIFVIENDNYDDISEFLNSSFVPYDDRLRDLYDVNQWVKNFDTEE